MPANPFLKTLGFAEDDRVAIIHADDLGMCQAALAAFEDLIDFGIVSSGSVMVPCSWFPQVASFCRRHPEADVGVHITTTCEWDSYRWGPISTAARSSGMFDDEGYFYRASRDFQENADRDAVEREIEAQIERAATAKIDITHIDNHMGTMRQAKFLPAYFQAATRRKLPIKLPSVDPARDDKHTVTMTNQFREQLRSRGWPVIDHGRGMRLDKADDRIAQVKAAIDALEPGLTHFVIHPAKDTPELRAIAPDWRGRVADYESFMSDEVRRYIARSGVKIIGYRQLRDRMRTA